MEKGIRPSGNPLIREEIALSWERSFTYGIHPYQDLFPPDPSVEQNNYLFQKNKLLIETTKAMITDEIMELFAISHLIVILFDRDLNLLCFFNSPEDKSYFTIIANKGFPVTDSGAEYIASSSKDEYLGTTATMLALRYGCPVQTNGPENFHDTMQPTTMSAAPILDGKGQSVGIIALARLMPEEYWTTEYHRDQINALCWTSSMALSIGQQMEIKKRNEELRKTNQMLEATLTFMDEGIVLAENHGKILKANRKSINILGIKEDSERQYNLCEFLRENSPLKHMLSLQANVNNLEDTLLLPEGDKNYLFSLRPIMGEQADVSDSMVIRISDPKQIDSYIAQRNHNTATLTFQDILGESSSIVKAKDISMRFASSFENVLILGESGTGKEIFAQAIHNASRPTALLSR